MNSGIILHDSVAARWLSFRNPHRIIEAKTIPEVVPAFEHVERLVNENNWYAAGFLCYEAAGAFDRALSSYPAGELPLLWFGLFPPPDQVDLPDPDYSAYSLGEPVSSVGRPEYGQAIERIKHFISAGDTYQVNYTLRLQIPFSGDPWHLFLAMVRAQSPGCAAWMNIERYAICSASPELFFRLEGNHLTCKPMKGTVKRGRTQREDSSLADWLHHSEKNRAENLMILDMIRNDLGRVANSGSVQVRHMFEVERHPTLWQMTSTVSAECRESVLEIMRALFPCASITGAPKIRTAQIIAELETGPRGLYTGCIGFIAPRRSAQFSVAIRTAVVDRDGKQAEYGSGGGIVWDSVADDEYKEALLKARVLTERRPDFSLLETMLWTSDEGYFLLDYHLRRLADSALYFNYPADAEQIKLQLARSASGFPREAQRVRLLVSRYGESVIEAAPMTESLRSPVRLGFARTAVDSRDIFLYHKTTQRRVYEAALESAPGFEDVLLWNERGELTESCVANVVLAIDGGLFTPPVDSGLLAGTFRALLLEKGTIRERVLTKDDLKRCSKIFLINSVRKWREAVVSNQ